MNSTPPADTMNVSIEGKGELEIEGLLGPQRAVVVEGGDALFGRDKVRAARFGYAGDEIHDRSLRRAFAPGSQGIIRRDADDLRSCHSSLGCCIVSGKRARLFDRGSHVNDGFTLAQRPGRSDILLAGRSEACGGFRGFRV